MNYHSKNVSKQLQKTLPGITVQFRKKLITSIFFSWKHFK